MKKIVMLFVSMLILTVIYAAIAYATLSDISSDNLGMVYSAFRRDSAPPDQIYTLEELGIVKIIKYEGNEAWVHVVVEKPDFPFEEKQPFFEYEGRLYQITGFSATPGFEHIPREPILWGGIALSGGWVLTGILFLKGRKKE